jgi:hypothetical protein
MARSLDIEEMRSALQLGRIEWHRHALERMVEREIARMHVLEVLDFGERIEDYSGDHPLPSALFLGTVEGRPIHVVAAFNARASMVHIITVYEPGSEKFEDDWRTRRT